MLSMGWVDPWVELGWVGNGARIFVFSGYNWVGSWVHKFTLAVSWVGLGQLFWCVGLGLGR